jgi:hypothetical protein
MEDTMQTTVYEDYSMDFTSRAQVAQNKDGKWFRRSQFRDPRYGYKWSSWRPSTFNPEGKSGQLLNVRLPK